MDKYFFLGYIIFLQACSISQPPDIIDDMSINNINNSYISEEDPSLKLYIVLKYPHIVENIISGEGPYIRALIQLSNKHDRKYQPELLELRKILNSSKNIYDFSEKIENNYKSN